MVRRIGCLACLALIAVFVPLGCGGDDAEEAPSSSDQDGATAASDGSPTKPSEASTPTPDGGGGDAALGPEESGEATYYAADGTGACGYKASANLDVAAMNKAQYAKSVCGKCASVTGPKGVVVVRIVDLCPGCQSGDLDLSKQAFAKIANLSAGRIPITWHFVACP